MLYQVLLWRLARHVANEARSYDQVIETSGLLENTKALLLR